MSFLIPFDMDKVERANLRKILSQNKPKISNVRFDRANTKLLVTYTNKTKETLDLGDKQDINDIMEKLKNKGLDPGSLEELQKAVAEIEKRSVVSNVSMIESQTSTATKYLTQHGGTALDSLYRKWLAQ